MKQHSAPVTAAGEFMPGSYIIWLSSPEIARGARPGQFVMVRCGDDTILRRPLSIHRRDGDKLALLFTVVGKGTDWLARRQPGDTIDLFGPLGNGFEVNPASTNLLLVAGGIGMAPLYFLANEAAEQKKQITLLLGAQTKSRLYPAYLLPPGITVVNSTEDGTAGHKGMVNELLPRYAAEADQICACGPAAMYHDMATKYRQSLKDKPVQVSLEMRMGCGLGICYGCTIRTKRGLQQVCQHGPVFELGDIVWDELFAI